METKAHLPTPLLNVEQFTKLPLNEQYAHLGALGYPDEYQERYQHGLKDFVALIMIEGISQVGIAWDVQELIIGTELVCALDTEGVERELGQYTVCFTRSSYRVTNETRTIGSFGHPHAYQGKEFCMSSGNGLIRTSLKDGRYSVAARMVITALYMKPGTVSIGNPYGTADTRHWPERGAK